MGDMDGCALWRVLLPISELQRQKYQGIEWGLKDDDRLALVAHKFDAVILPRMHWEASERDKADKWIGALHKAGIAVIYEVDDDLFSEDFERRLILKDGYSKVKARERRGSILHTMQQCDGATVSSQRLATMVRQYLDIPIRVVPNYIDLNWFHRIQRGSKRDPNLTGLTIGWAGGFRPSSDLIMMVKAWARLAEEYPDITFVVMGHYDPAFFEYLPEDRIAMLDWMPIKSYPAGMLNIDIGCAPLASTTFNRAKTYIKAMEYAASGAPVVASPTVYGQLIEHEVDGYIARSSDDWYEYLKRLIDNEWHRHEIADRLYEKVRLHHSLDLNAWRWVEAWTDLVNGFRRNMSHIYLPKGVEIHANAAA